MVPARFILGLFCTGFFNHVVDSATFYYNPGTVSLHENEDSETALFSFTTTCTVRNTCYRQVSNNCYTCDHNGDNCNVNVYTCYAAESYTCYNLFSCNTCTYSGDNRFYLTGTTFYKRACTSPGCGPSCSLAYCNNAGESYSASITCYHTGYETDDQSTMSFTVSITQNVAPTFHWFYGSSIDVYPSSGVNSWVNRVVASDADNYIDSGTIYYSLQTGVDPSWNHGNNLFRFDTSNGYVYVDSDLSIEFSYYYSLTACVYDRRQDTTCHSLNLTLHSCYQTPNCTDQSFYEFHDTHGSYSGHGTSNTLFTQTYPDPGDHFNNFHSGWHQLNWRFTRNDFDNLNDPPTTIGLYTGEIYITKNISIFPSYPYQDFTMVVEVSNPSASCYVTTCTFQARVWYTNWPIEIRSLPYTATLPENTDSRTLIHTIIIFDYNFYWEDNFTCVFNGVTSNTGVNEQNLFEVDQIYNGYAYNSWGIYKKVCQTPDCGYLGSNFLCARDIGCMNHNETQEYVISVTCSDGYGTSDTDFLTFQPIQNRAPTFLNLPLTITLDSDEVASLDIIFSILYWDFENENLFYLYTYTETTASPPADPGFWLGTTWGNYYNSLGNISTTVHLHNTTNATYTIYVDAHERRNQIFDTLTIIVNEYCGAVPSCTGTAVDITNEQAVGSALFSVQDLASGGSGSGRSYAIASSANYFAADTTTGSVTLNSALPAVFPNATYSISTYVYETNACQYATCTSYVHVTAVNNPISITNLGASVNIHEDTKAATSLYTIDTSDPDSADTVDCSITSISPDEADPDHFFLTETVTGSDVFQVYSRQNPGFTASTLQYLVTIVCQDGHSSSSTGTLSVNIDQNQAPTITNLGDPTTLTIDPGTQNNGDVIYSVSTSDTENDPITFACTISTTDNPFECSSSNSVGYIVLRRALDVIDDNGQTFSVQVCISDAKHSSAACGSLQTTMTSSKTTPYISNLPASVSIAENAASGTSLYDIDYTDPDVGETHTFTLYSVSPSAGTSLFSLDTSTGVVSTAAGSFDYEQETSYSLEVLVRDNYLEATNTKFLTVGITNVNEAPTLTAGVDYVNLTESWIPGAAIQFYFWVTDPDVDDTHLFSITSGTNSGSFSVDTANGELSLVSTWDLDTGSPSEANLVVTATDGGGLTSTVGVTLSFANVNDNTPTVTVTGDATDIQISDSTNIITDLLSLSCSDADINDDNLCDFGVIGEGDGVEFFLMEVGSKRALGNTATLRLKTALNLDYNRTFTFTIQVCDGTGSDALCNGVPVTVTYTASAAASPTRPGGCAVCSTRGKVLIGFVALEGVIILGIIGHLIWHFCLKNKHSLKADREMEAVHYSRSKSSRLQKSDPRPSTSNPHQNPIASGSNNQIFMAPKPKFAIKRSRPPERPSVSAGSGLFAGSSMMRPTSGHISREDSDSSLSSFSSSDDEVRLPDRVMGNTVKGIRRAGHQSHVYSKNRPSSGLPNPIYR